MEMTHQKFIYFCEIQIQVNSMITSVHQFHDSINCIRIVNIKLIVNSHWYKICGLWIVSFQCWHFLETFRSMRLQSVAQNMYVHFLHPMLSSKYLLRKYITILQSKFHFNLWFSMRAFLNINWVIADLTYLPC